MMLSYTLYLLLFLSIFPMPRLLTRPPTLSSLNLNDTSKRRWDSIHNLNELTSYMRPITTTISPACRASYMHPSVLRVPYETARIFPSTFSYSFPVHGSMQGRNLFAFTSTPPPAPPSTHLNLFSQF
ncbi:Non-specific serine/threonine protein kinase [Handroanthus impetiginosus]|uniref:Non-specific serine/threonine protein kinase n=1 Tax=Handroanthus impetiginosus TaxID=429701 RepID=A0A2G9IAL1_9LAMI|nr:Non-specific serine/threonine protein kinase [Handroanthus impetiginosus]